MSRTLNGNLRGRAARTEMEDLHELHDSRLTAWQFLDVAEELSSIMGNEYDAWVDATPEIGFHDATIAKLLELKLQEENPVDEAQHIERDVDAMLASSAAVTRIPYPLASVRYPGPSNGKPVFLNRTINYDEGCGNDDMRDWLQGGK
jgi:hypothetical protein